MQIIKILNTSVVLAKNDNDEEVILSGKGIGFNNKIGNTISESEAEKVYVLRDKNTVERFLELVSDMPVIYLKITEHIIQYAKEKLKITLNDQILVTLSDHINFAVLRLKENKTIKNRLLWEVQKLYPEEYRVGIYAVQYINELLDINFPEDEAGNIAFHIINSEREDSSLNKTIFATEMVKNIINIIQYYFGIILDKESLNYNRFVTYLHIAIRDLSGKNNVADEDDFLYRQVKEKYSEEYKCVRKINEFIENKTGQKISNDEKAYLVIQVNRVINR